MKIGILGTGSAGRALGTGFVQFGHEVKMGSRDPNNVAAEVSGQSLAGKSMSGKWCPAPFAASGG